MSGSLVIANGDHGDPYYTFFWVMFIFVVVMLVITASYIVRRLFDRQSGEIGGWELRGAWGRIRAVARTTLAEGLRAKLAAGFAVIVLISIPIFWLTSKGDGTIKGKLQMFIAYSLGFTSFVLALLTIFFSCRSLAVEIAGRQIYAIATKPIPRWQVLAGKYLGVMSLNVVLVAMAVLGIYLGVQASVSSFKSHLAGDLVEYANLTPVQAQKAVDALDHVKGIGATGYGSPILGAMGNALGMTPDQVGDLLLRLPEQTRVDLRRFDQLRRQVLTARAGVPPEIPDLTARIEEEYKKREQEERIPENLTPKQVRDQIKLELQKEFCAIPYGGQITWTMKGPPPVAGEDALMSIRFKLVPAGYMAELKSPEGNLEEDTFVCAWAVGDPSNDPGKGKFFSNTTKHPVNTFDEFEIPQQGVAPDGTVLLHFANIDPRRVEAIFEIPTGGLEVLYRVASFEMNLVQAGLAILIMLACLTAFGVCASTFLSFPVASLIVLTLYVLSASIGFVAESLGTTSDYYDPDNMTTELKARQAVVAAMDWLLSIGRVDSGNQLIEGRSIGWYRLWEETWRYVLVKGLVVMAVAVVVFRRRELASVVV